MVGAVRMTFDIGATIIGIVELVAIHFAAQSLRLFLKLQEIPEGRADLPLAGDFVHGSPINRDAARVVTIIGLRGCAAVENVETCAARIGLHISRKLRILRHDLVEKITVEVV